MKGEKIHIEKNLLYQIKTEAKSGKIPEVKTAFSIGKDNTSDYAFPKSTMKKTQCTIEFDSLWGWQIKDQTGGHDICRTSVYAASKYKIDSGEPSLFIQLFDKMVFTTGDYDFTVSGVNKDPRFLPTDIFEDDNERFYEETEEEVRKKMTDMYSNM